MSETLAIVGAGGVLGAKLVEHALAAADARVYAFTHGATPAIPAAQSDRVIWQPLDCRPCAHVDCPIDGHPCATGVAVARVIGEAMGLLEMDRQPTLQ